MDAQGDSDYRTWLVRTHHQASQDFDKAIMTLSSAGLGLGVAFVGDAFTHPIRAWTLIASWMLFGLSLLAIVLSFVLSLARHERLIGQLDSDKPTNSSPRTFRGVYLTWTNGLNAVAAAAFLLGTVFLIAFAIINVGRLK